MSELDRGTVLRIREGEVLATLQSMNVCDSDEPPLDETHLYDDQTQDFSADIEGCELEDTHSGTRALPFDEDMAQTGTQVVYLRDHVAVWPSSQHCILGRLSLIKQCSVTFLAWLPYGRQAAASGKASTVVHARLPHAAAHKAAGLSHAERARYAIHPIPMSEVRALRCRTPLLLVASVVLVLQDGLSLPPMHFHAGGLRELMACLKKHLGLTQTLQDRSVFLVNDMSDPLPRSLATCQSLEDIMGMQQARQEEPRPAPLAITHLSAASGATEAQPRPASVLLDLTADEGAGDPGALGGCRDDVQDAACVDNTVQEEHREEGLVKPGSQQGRKRQGLVEPGSQEGHEEEGLVKAGSQEGLQGAAAGADPADIDAMFNSWDTSQRNLQPSGSTALATPWAVWILGIRRRIKAAAVAAVTTAAASASDYISWQESLAEEDATAAAFYRTLDFEIPGAAAAAAATALTATSKADQPDGNDGATEASGCKGETAAAATAHAAAAAAAAADSTVPDASSASNSCSAIDCESLEDFELVDAGIGLSSSSLLQGSAGRVQLPPLSTEEWHSMFDQGRLVEVSTLQRRTFGSGMDPSIRREAWKFLLGLYPLNSSEEERRDLMMRRRKEYQALRMQWESISPSQASRFDPWRERCSRINKDARRTDRHLPFFALERGPNVAALRRILLTYAMYNFNLGYCQGMSDLASPLLYVMCDEVEAFWCFAALMERVGSHFDEQQSGVQAQLKALREVIQVLDPPLHSHLESLDALAYFFCFRWLLVLFKREFQLEEVLRLWEAAWACPFTGHLLVYLAAAVLVHHRRDIMEQACDLDALLRLCCLLPGRLQLEPLLVLAEKLAGYAAQAGLDLAAAADLPPAAPLAAVSHK